jgi:hypothetical protein
MPQSAHGHARRLASEIRWIAGTAWVGEIGPDASDAFEAKSFPRDKGD